MSTRAFDIRCPIVDERLLASNADVNHGHPRQPRDPAVGASSSGRWGKSAPPTLVTSNSPLPLRRSAETLARYFRREFSYDFVNYEARERDPNCEVWLWTSRADGCLYATGHAVFWRIAFDDRPAPEWELGSAWQHPYFRGHGRLTAIWPWWAQSYGPFWVSHPWSPAMQAFMARHAGHEFPDGTTAQEPVTVYRSREGR